MTLLQIDAILLFVLEFRVTVTLKEIAERGQTRSDIGLVLEGLVQPYVPFLIGIKSVAYRDTGPDSG